MNQIIWKFEKVAFPVTFFVSLYIFFSISKVNGIVSILFVVLLFLGGYYSSQKNSLVLILICFYVWFVGPFSIAVASIIPTVIGTIVSHSIVDYIDNTQVIISYCSKLVLFFVIFLFSSYANDFFVIKEKTEMRTMGFLKIRSIIFWASILAFFEAVVRKTFKINIPGFTPIIPFAGVILYIFQGCNMFFLFLALHFYMVKKTKISFKDVLKIVSVAIITQIPNIIIGKRGGFLNTTLMIILFSCIMKLDMVNLRPTTKKRFYRIVFFSALLLLLGVGVTNLFRVGQFETVGFLINRFTGLLDGVIAINGIGNSSAPYSLLDFFTTVIFGSEMTSNKYYTINILGYSVTAVHSNAMPIFVGEWFYGGTWGIIVITIIESFVLTMFEKSIKRNVYSMGKYRFRIKKSAAIFCSLYLILLLFTFHFIDGNITSWKPFVPILICYFLASVTKENKDEFTIVDRNWICEKTKLQ